MKKLFLIGCVLLGACSAAQVQQAQNTTLTVFKDACAASAFADMAFAAAVGPMKISAADVAKEASIYATVQKVCSQAPADINLAFGYVGQAMVAISTGTSTGTVPDVPAPAAAATTPASG